MRLRPYIADRDFDVISKWVTDARTHAMWCAGRFGYPLEKENFNSVLAQLAVTTGDSPFVATTDSGDVTGFFCYSSNLEANEGMLKFVMVDSSRRGQGVGKEMLGLAVKYAFEIAKVDAVHLNVFAQNVPAVRCYAGAGFAERDTAAAAFSYNDERWDRCNMIRSRDASGE